MLSNLLWWPWSGIGSGGPPPPFGGDQNVMGGRLSDAQAQWAETARMRRLEDMEMEEIMAVLLSEL